MTFFFGDNRLHDDIILDYLINVENLVYTTFDPMMNRMVLSVNKDSNIPQNIHDYIGIKDTIIFDSSDREWPSKKTTVFKFSSTSIDLHPFLRNLKEMLAVKPGVYRLSSQSPGRGKRVNIYITTYYRFEKTKNCIDSIVSKSCQSDYDVVIYVGDNNTRDEKMIDYLESVKDIFLIKNDKNIGKSRMVNKLHRQARECDYIFSIDGDMVMDGEKNQIDMMIELLEEGHNIGLVSSNQTGQSEHWFGRTVFEKVEGKYIIAESNNGIGVSGGCICMKKDDWERIEMYEENYDLYTADDAILMDKIDQKLKKRAVISVNCSLYHPPSTSEEKGYVEWKRDKFLKKGLKFREGLLTGNEKNEKEEKEKKEEKGYFD